VEFGRYRNARSFAATSQSFVIVPYNPIMESPRGFSIEAWLYLRDISRYELSVIAARWTPIPNEQSWVFAVVGRKLGSVATPSPGWFEREVTPLTSGRLKAAGQRMNGVGNRLISSSMRMRHARREEHPPSLAGGW
jgi:hypothetical protein